MGVNLGRVSGTRIREVGTRIRTQIHTITHNYTHLHTKLHNITQNIQIYTEFTQKTHKKNHKIYKYHTNITILGGSQRIHILSLLYIFIYIYRKLQSIHTFKDLNESHDEHNTTHNQKNFQKKIFKKKFSKKISFNKK